MEITIEMLEQKHPDIVAAIIAKNKTEITVDILNANHPDIVAALAGAAAKKERDRILAVKDQLIPGHETLINELMFDGQTTGEQAAVKVLQAERTARLNVNNALAADAPKPVAPVVVPDVENTLDPDENTPLEERAKAVWDKSKKIRDEFLNKFDVYLAYLKADQAGQVRILGSKVQK